MHAGAVGGVLVLVPTDITDGPGFPPGPLLARLFEQEAR
jgi:hypothetical protein